MSSNGTLLMHVAAAVAIPMIVTVALRMEPVGGVLIIGAAYLNRTQAVRHMWIMASTVLKVLAIDCIDNKCLGCSAQNSCDSCVRSGCSWCLDTASCIPTVYILSLNFQD